MSNIPVVSEFTNVLPEEVPRLPLAREVEFGIDVLLGTMPIPWVPTG